MTSSPLILEPALADAVARARTAEPSAEAAKAARQLMDLTNLDEGADRAAIEALCRRAVEGPEPVAAVCLYPQWVSLAKRLLVGTPVKVATVANFPEPTGAPASVADESAAAIADGADEVDIVMPHAAVRAGDPAAAASVVAAARAACGNAVCLKVILETGAFDSAAPLAEACRIALDNGADFLKTSTGKIGPGASLEAAAVLLDATSAAPAVGVKIAGGVRTVADAAAYLRLAEDRHGSAYLAPATFRIGASSLLDDVGRWLGPEG